MAKEWLDEGIELNLNLLRELYEIIGHPIPLTGDIEIYWRKGKPVLRKKTSVFRRLLPQQEALRECAIELHKADLEGKIKSRADVYEFMDKCMAEHGFGIGKGRY